MQTINDVEVDCPPLPIATNDDDKMELLVLGNGDRRACCNCDFDDKRTLFLWIEQSEEKNSIKLQIKSINILWLHDKTHRYARCATLNQLV